MFIPQELESLVVRPRSASKHTRATLAETTELLHWLRSRQITQAALARYFSISNNAVSLWFRQGLPLNRLRQIKALQLKILRWEQESDCIFPGPRKNCV